MDDDDKRHDDAMAHIEDLIQIGKRAVANAQEASRRAGVPNVYSINGRIYYELPNGELSLEDPWPQMQAEKAAREAEAQK